MTGTNGESLKEILNSIDKGETQLPDFQRGWVWDDRRIQMLIASLTNNYPIGAAMFLDNTGNNFHFKSRLVEGVEYKNVAPRYLILDGQQRFTSIYLALYSKKPVEITEGGNRKIYRLWNSVINKTPLYARSNRFIQGDAPSKYSDRVIKKLNIDSDTYDAFVASHAIDVESFRKDDFSTFYNKRAKALCLLIENATMKKVDGMPEE